VTISSPLSSILAPCTHIGDGSISGEQVILVAAVEPVTAELDGGVALLAVARRTPQREHAVSIDEPE